MQYITIHLSCIKCYISIPISYTKDNDDNGRVVVYKECYLILSMCKWYIHYMYLCVNLFLIVFHVVRSYFYATLNAFL